MAARVTDVVVVDEAGGEGEQAQSDASAEALGRAAGVGFEGELALAGPEDRFDSLAHRAERAVAVRFVAAVGSEEARTEGGHVVFELAAGEALVGHDGVAVKADAGEHFGGDDALGDVRRGQLETDRHPVWGAQQVQPEAPEVAAVALAPAVGA